ncbi:MAG: hypothetical protein GY904_12610 [Planctomycetaceae bacterium]|nr:hypothetical protein [Planctomycetaceae bacterium]
MAEDRRPHVSELEPWLQQVASEVTATFRYAGRLGGTVNPDLPLLLCGRVAEVPGVDSLLANLLGRPAANWRYAGPGSTALFSLSGGLPRSQDGLP